MKRKKKKNRQLALLILLLGITIGFALLSTTLYINGTAGIKSSQWDIHWENVQPNAESTVTTETPSITENATKVSYEVTLELPGDYYEFTVDAKNDGSINGKITKVDHKVYAVVGGVPSTEPTTLPSYINYSIYYDGTTTEPAEGDILASGAKQTYRIRIEYDPEATTLPSSDLTYKVEDEITYTQTKDSNTPPEPEDTSVPDLWFYEINQDGANTASIVAINTAYDQTLATLWESGTSEFLGSYEDWTGPTIPDYIKNVVAPRKVKLDANGHYDPTNGTEYTITRFYDATWNANMSQTTSDYVSANHGGSLYDADNLITSMVFPDTYTVINFVGDGYNLLETLTLSDNLTTVDDLNMNMFAYYSNGDPKLELTIPSHVTSLGEGSICSGKLKSVTVPSTVTTVAQDACCAYNGTKYYAADAATKSRLEAAGCTVEPLE